MSRTLHTAITTRLSLSSPDNSNPTKSLTVLPFASTLDLLANLRFGA